MSLTRTGAAVSSAGGRHLRVGVTTALALLGASGVLVHFYTGEAAPSWLDGIPLVVYPTLTVGLFATSTRRFAQWSLLIWAWVMLVTAIITVVPVMTLDAVDGQPVVHYLTHVLCVVLQIPLIVRLAGRLREPVIDS